LVASSGWRYRVPPRKAILLVVEVILSLSRRKFSLAYQVKSRHAIGDQGHEHQPSREPLKSPKRDRRKKSRPRQDYTHYVHCYPRFECPLRKIQRPQPEKRYRDR